jgi:uncharacterized protein YjiS (DUF1127 family)
MFKFFKKYGMYRKTYDELSRMSDKELSDIGISRCDIKRIAKQSL